jgi:serine/threonine-protein kinase
MRRFFLPLFIALAAGGAAFIIATAGDLPLQVGSHFTRGDQPNAWTPRDTYVAIIVDAATLLPLFLVTLITRLPRVFPSAVNIPNRDYWLAPERRERSLATLADFGWAFGCLLTLFIVGVHWVVVSAHTSAPTQLPDRPFQALIGGFIAAMCVWTVALCLRFRRPG